MLYRAASSDAGPAATDEVSRCADARSMLTAEGRGVAGASILGDEAAGLSSSCGPCCGAAAAALEADVSLLGLLRKLPSVPEAPAARGKFPAAARSPNLATRLPTGGAAAVSCIGLAATTAGDGAGEGCAAATIDAGESAAVAGESAGSAERRAAAAAPLGEADDCPGGGAEGLAVVGGGARTFEASAEVARLRLNAAPASADAATDDPASPANGQHDHRTQELLKGR